MDSFIETNKEFREYDAVGATCEADLDCKCNLTNPRYRARHHLNKYQIIFILVFIIFIEVFVLSLIHFDNYAWILMGIMLTLMILFIMINTCKSRVPTDREQLIV